MRKHCLLLFIFYIISIYSFSQNLINDSLINYSYKIQGINRITNQHVNAGTGFIIKYNYNYFIVTNYHVLTGKDPLSRLKLSNLTDTCTSIIINFRNKVDTGFKKLVMNLFDSSGTKLFSLYHGHQDSLLDIAVLPIFSEDFPPDIKEYFIDYNNIDSTTNYQPSKTIFIVGFPFGKMKNKWMPTIIKCKSVREIMDGFFVSPHFSFDSSTIEGMSGSPIYLENDSGIISLVGVNALNNPNDSLNPNLKGKGVLIKFICYLIESMVEQNKANVDLFYQ